MSEKPMLDARRKRVRKNTTSQCVAIPNWLHDLAEDERRKRGMSRSQFYSESLRAKLVDMGVKVG